MKERPIKANNFGFGHDYITVRSSRGEVVVSVDAKRVPGIRLGKIVDNVLYDYNQDLSNIAVCAADETDEVIIRIRKT